MVGHAKGGNKLAIALAPTGNRTARAANTGGFFNTLKARIATSALLVTKPTSNLLLLSRVHTINTRGNNDQAASSWITTLFLVNTHTEEVLWAGTQSKRTLIFRKKGTCSFTTRTIPADEKLELSSDMNGPDALAAMRKLAQQALTSPWIRKATKQPILRVYPFRNRGSQVLPTAALTAFFQVELLRSGKVRLLARPWRERAQPMGTVKPVVATGTLSGHIESFPKRPPQQQGIQYHFSAKGTNAGEPDATWTGKVVLKKKHALTTTNN
ncbi:MAG: hypothetical protein JRH20_24595 [Deltaproteobacteria bacterium]|nr:hypothetical protein [Deltaproteobacteria bacterium]